MNKVLQKNKKWSEISREITGRTENAVKNRFNSMMKKWEITKKYDESIPESTKIQELYDNFIEKSKNEFYNRQRNNILLVASFKKTNPYGSKKRFHLKDVLAKNNTNLLFELIESENKQKSKDQKEVITTDLKRKHESFIKEEPPLRKINKIEDNLLKNNMGCFQIKTEYNGNSNSNTPFLNNNRNLFNVININSNYTPGNYFGNQQNSLLQQNFYMNFMRNNQNQQRSFSMSNGVNNNSIFLFLN